MRECGAGIHNGVKMGRIKIVLSLLMVVLCTGNGYSQDVIETRFSPPPNFVRQKIDTSSFGYYLRHLPLKPVGSLVKYYDGKEKANDDVYVGVVKMDIGAKNLQQCADAVMRLRGEYLYAGKKYDKIHFELLYNLKPKYFKEYAKGDYSYANFRKYMELIFTGANTSSLHHELATVTNFSSMKIGDVFIQKGSPYGHAVIVVDMASNLTTGAKVYLLAQSYMPAQETQILTNPYNKNLSPWYELKEGTVATPEWTFQSSDLKRFKDE